jgi:hypothetical protein
MPHKMVNGVKVELTDAEIAELAASEAEWIAGERDRLAAAAREQRDKLLADTDWTQVADAPVDQAAWATYRQALRDIPQQAGFPENVTWPEEPNG